MEIEPQKISNEDQIFILILTKFTQRNGLPPKQLPTFTSYEATPVRIGVMCHKS